MMSTSPHRDRRPVKASVFQTRVEEGAPLTIVLGPATTDPVRADLTHQFGDTHARVVFYSALATTRFREQFESTSDNASTDRARFSVSTPGASVDGPDDPIADRRARVRVPSTARPDTPKIRAIVPLYGWRDAAKPRRGAHRAYTVERQLHGAALRVYIDRPWFSSGDAEQLAVLTWPGARAWMAAGKHELPSRIRSFVTQWGMDPIWASAPLTSVFRADHLRGAGHPADGNGFTLEEVERPGQPYPSDFFVDAALFTPTYDADQRLWYRDLHFADVTSYRPFVRLAVARFQPHSIAVQTDTGSLIRDTHLSRVILADFAQLSNDRFASATYYARERELVVSVSGIGYSASSERVGSSTMMVSLERRVSGEPDGWVTEVPDAPLSAATNPDGITVWQGRLPLPNIKVRRRRHRVVFREFEHLPSDTLASRARLVYADFLEL